VKFSSLSESEIPVSGRQSGDKAKSHVSDTGGSSDSRCRLPLHTLEASGSNGGKILIVDDSEPSRILLMEMLSAEGYDVRPADSGALALSAVNADPPELILLDMRMPGMDGVEFCRKLKSHAESRDIPVIFLSASLDFAERLEGLETGAIDFINKPFQREELLARLKNYLELARLQKGLEHRVAERTAELQTVNSQLESELRTRKRVEEELRDSEHRFRTIADSAPAALWMTSPEGLFTYMSQGGLNFTGQTPEEISGNGWRSAIHPEDVDRTIQAIEGAVRDQSRYQIELRLRKASGEYGSTVATGIPVFLDGEFTGHIGITLDITGLKREQERAVANQKLESLGVLSAGIAHDFNNLLSTILAHADLALDELPVDSPARENAATISKVALHASEIVALLMDYAGSTGAGEPEPVELNSLVRETIRLVRGSFSKTAAIEVDLALKASQPVRASPGPVRQVLLNLIMNAVEALEGKPGTIAVSTSLTRVSHGFTGSGSSAPPPGEYVLLEVSDTGCGMTEEAKARVFDPFFSSKALGRGLGLASVQGILRGIGGAVRVMSSSGHGSTFSVWLPCWDSRSESEEGEKDEFSAAGSRRAPAVLLVDDEDLLRAAVERALQREGFSVIAARDGFAAVELFAKHSGDIDVVVLDISLPFLSGRDVCERLRELKKDVQVLFTSGHDSIPIRTPHGQAPNGQPPNGQAKERFLRKPYRLGDLVRNLREMMPPLPAGVIVESEAAAKPRASASGNSPS
jgi:PAS domain S-box-containing protein